MEDKRFDIILDRKNRDEILSYLGDEDWKKYYEFGTAIYEGVFANDYVIGIKKVVADDPLYSELGKEEYLTAYVFAKLDADNNIIGDNVYAYYTFNEEVNRYGPDVVGFGFRDYDEKIEYVHTWLNGSTIYENKRRKETKGVHKKVKDMLNKKD